MMAQVRYGKVERTRERWFRAYAEDLAENTPLSEGLQIEAEMTARAQARVVESRQFLRAADISKLAAGSVKNPSGALNRWKQKRQIFAIEMKAEILQMTLTRPEYSLCGISNHAASTGGFICAGATGKVKQLPRPAPCDPVERIVAGAKLLESTCA